MREEKMGKDTVVIEGKCSREVKEEDRKKEEKEKRLITRQNNTNFT